MQGRLSPMVDGKIQAFPWNSWRDEFLIARDLHISQMEWTLDQKDLYDNPLMTEVGRAEIRALCLSNSIQIPSLTGDCFMQAPFWKVSGAARVELEKDFIAIVQACCEVGISILVMPLVDNGSLENMHQEDALIHFLEKQSNLLHSNSVRIVFESDFEPNELLRFISRLDPVLFGINYDIGNSAALGFDPEEEIEIYGDRILNVHVKDRKLGGTTVPLGSGDANFEDVFKALAKVGYSGNFILQTARASNEDHDVVLCQYRNMTLELIKLYES
ncbi:sugar phosphate isomerase/epimerase [Polynucleobacter paneuropaeus]|nr:sugar phosphate isomerase/epimerase [Polynucleobacter paneuropaeus]